VLAVLAGAVPGVRAAVPTATCQANQSEYNRMGPLFAGTVAEAGPVGASNEEFL